MHPLLLVLSCLIDFYCKHPVNLYGVLCQTLMGLYLPKQIQKDGDSRIRQ